MELLMPNQYIEMQEEEMMYLDGGFDKAMFGKNINGLWGKLSQASRSKAFAGWAGAVKVAATYSYAAAVAKFGGFAVQASFCVGGVYAALIAAMAAGAAIAYLGKNRVFY